MICRQVRATAAWRLLRLTSSTLSWKPLASDCQGEEGTNFRGLSWTSSESGGSGKVATHLEEAGRDEVVEGIGACQVHPLVLSARVRGCDMPAAAPGRPRETSLPAHFDAPCSPGFCPLRCPPAATWGPQEPVDASPSLTPGDL
eukprot:549487-Hanusia_phi.AAC.2